MEHISAGTGSGLLSQSESRLMFLNGFFEAFRVFRDIYGNFVQIQETLIPGNLFYVFCTEKVKVPQKSKNQG